MSATAVQDFDLSEAEFRQISDLVYEYCRINLHDGKKDLVRARIAKQLRAGGFASTEQYIQHVRGDRSGRALVMLVDSVSTNLTSFFRESKHFDHLREKFLPNLIVQKRAQKRCRMRAWSAGCSSGEEAYTLAMVLSEALRKQGAWDVKILATDISTRVLDIAKRGTYPKSCLRDVPQQLLGEYFASAAPSPDARPGEQATYSVTSPLRNLVAFRRLNLMDSPWPFSGSFDFIFCRNVMIYFDKPTQERLVDRYWESLEPGGLLFTGHSESLTGIKHRFRYVEPTIYAKQ